MRKFLVLTAVLGATIVPTVASAAPNQQGQCRQDANDLFVSLSTEGTRGDFMSDVIFGNEPNTLPDGSIVPSQSPGPFVNTGPNEPPRNDRTMGFGGGDLQAAVRAACNA